MPAGTYDMIVRNSKCLSRKISNLVLRPGKNPIKYYTRGRLSMPEFVTIKSHDYYRSPPSLMIGFKLSISENEKQRISMSMGCTVQSTYSSNDYEFYKLIIPENYSVAEMIDYFINFTKVAFVEPEILYLFD
jgi:hypothetical protein